MTAFRNTVWFYAVAFLILSCGTTSTLRGAGAITPFTVVEAESGTLGGGATLRAFAPGSAVPSAATLELEASGMALVELKTNGDFVSLTNPVASANAIVIRNSIPDAPNGGGITNTIDLYVDGVFRQAVTLSSRQSWVYRNATTNPDDPNAGGVPYRFYNEDRALITGAPIAAGSIITLEKDSTNSAAVYDIDCVDLENVAPPITQPTNSLSIAAAPYNADPTFTTDSTTAIKNCINDARTQRKSVWIPQGKFMLNFLSSGGLDITGVTVNGAGVWYSTLYRNVPLPPPTTPWRSNIHLGTNSTIRDVFVDSDAIYRSIGGVGGDDYGLTSNGTNWLVERVWIQHCDAQWMSGSFGTFRDSRVYGSWADGLNLNNGNSPNNSQLGISLTASNNFVRGSGDDNIATYSDSGASGTNPEMQNTRIINNTTVAAYWANGLRIAGGTNVTVQGNLIESAPSDNGMEVSVFGTTGHPLDSALVADNVIMRGGGWNGTDRHGMHVGSQTGMYTRAVITNNIIKDALRDGVKIGSDYEALVMSHNIIDHPAQNGVQIDSGVTGTGVFEYNFVTNLPAGKQQYINGSPATFLTTQLSNSWSVVGPLIKSDTPTMNLATDWGGTAPAAGQSGEFDDTISANNSANLTLGGNVTLDSLLFFSNMNGPAVVGPGNTLTLATTSGLSMVVANEDVTLNCALVCSAFNIGSGRTLTLGGGSTAFLSGTSGGAGTVMLNATSAKSFTANGNPIVNMGNPVTGIGGLIIGNNCTLTESGSFQIGDNGSSGVVTINSPTAALNTSGSAGTIMVARNGGASNGRLTLINGSISTAGSTDVSGLQIGLALSSATAKGWLDIQGGTLNVPQTLVIGNSIATAGVQAAMTVEGGTSTVGTINFGASSSAGSGSLTMTGGTLYIGSGGMNQLGTGTFTNTLTLSGGTVGASADWSSSQPMILSTVNGSITFQAADASATAHNVTLSGTLSGTGGLIKIGSGTLTLNGTNSYTGAVTINGGTLALVTTNNSSRAYTNNGGTLNVRRTAAGGALSAGELAFGNGSAVTFDFAGFGASLTPLIASSSKLAISGNVLINVSNAPLSGTSVLVTYAGTRTGSGNFVAGTVPAGASIVDDPIGKKVSLTYFPNASPMIGSMSVAPGSIGLSGSNGAPFLTYRILSSSNLTTWLPIWTNTFDSSGNFNIFVPSDPASPNAFYRLITP